MSDLKLPWVLKYSPKKIDDLVLTNELKDLFKGYISKNTLSNVTFYGEPGIGKSTLAKILVDELGVQDVLFQSCSIDGSIDMVKTKIQSFCQIVTPPGKLKVVILDEADSLTQTGGQNAGAQMALRNIILEAQEDTRFILTCNYIDRIIPALQSRCTPIKIEFSIKDIATRVLYILKQEKIKFTKETINDFINLVIKKRYPDIRSIISELELSCQTGELKILTSTTNVVTDEILNFILENKNIRDIRTFLIHNEEQFSGDYLALASKLFDYYMEQDVDLNIPLLISDYMYKMSIVPDKEIMFSALIIELKRS